MSNRSSSRSDRLGKPKLDRPIKQKSDRPGKSGTVRSHRRSDPSDRIDYPHQVYSSSAGSVKRYRQDSTGLIVLLIVVLLVTALLSTAYNVHWTKPSTMAFVGATKNITFEDVDIEGLDEVPGIFEYFEHEGKKSFGTQCNIEYRDYRSFGFPKQRPLAIVPAGYCKVYTLKNYFPLYRPYNRLIGKYLHESKHCYIFDDHEYVVGYRAGILLHVGGVGAEIYRLLGVLFGPAATQYMKFDMERFFFVDAKYYLEQGCNTVPFNNFKDITIAVNKNEKYKIRKFLLGRCIVSSYDCGNMEYIPGFYSTEHHVCYYTKKDSTPQIHTNCEVLCDRFPFKKDIFYDTNKD